MSDWISCQAEMPPKSVWVEVKRHHAETRKACLKGIFTKRWVYPSGLCKMVSEDDYWRPILPLPKSPKEVP